MNGWGCAELFSSFFLLVLLQLLSLWKKTSLLRFNVLVILFFAVFYTLALIIARGFITFCWPVMFFVKS